MQNLVFQAGFIGHPVARQGHVLGEIGHHQTLAAERRPDAGILQAGGVGGIDRIAADMEMVAMGMRQGGDLDVPGGGILLRRFRARISDFGLGGDGTCS